MNIIFKPIINNNLFIIIGSLISLTLLGCDKNESKHVNSSTTKQILNVQESTSADDNTQSQPIQDIAHPNDEQNTESTDNNMPAESVPDETPKVQQEDQAAEPSDVVKMVEYNEYKVSGTRMIAKFPGAEGRHKDLPVKIELKVRCVADNPEQCECIDGPSGPYPGQVIHTVPCDIKRIKDVENVHKHGTINNFEKLLKLVKQSPEKHQYAVSFMDIKPEKDKHSDFQALEIRKLCPVQDGIISEDCECFKAESHDPNTFFVTSGRVTTCP